MSALKKLQRICKERQVRFESFFDMFDRLHSKKISKAEFVRALSIAGVRLSQNEITELCDSYESVQFPDKIRYLDLCDDVNSVFTIKGLESQPPLSPMSTTTLSRQAPMLGVQTRAEIDDVKVALGYIRHQSSVNGAVIKNFFKDYDHNNCGCIPLEEFVRACNLLDNRIAPSAALALATAYSQLQPNGMTLVNYRCIHDDCTDDSAFAGSAMSRLTRDGTKYNEMANPEAPHWWQQMEVGDMEDQLATAMAQLRLGRSTAFSFFQSQDKYRSGSVPVTAFKRGCKEMFTGVPFTEDMFAVLCQAYGNSSGQVAYAKFLEALYAKLGRFGFVSAGGSSSSPSETNMNNNNGGSGSGSSTARPPTTGRPHATSAMPPSSSSSSGGFSSAAASASPVVTLLGNHLQNPARSMKVASPLARPTSRFGAAAIAALVATDGGRVVEQALVKPGMRTGLGLGVGSASALLSEPEAQDLEVVLERIRKQVATRRIDLKWKLQDYDTKSCSTATQHEHITTNQFARGLSELNLLSVPPDYEVRLLASRFAPADGRHEPLKYVNYRSFLACVDETYSPSLWGGSLRLDGESKLTQGNSRGDPLKAQLQLLKIRPSTSVGGPNRGLKVIVADLVDHCKTKRIRLDDFFKDGDGLRHGILARHKFRVGLSSAGCLLAESEFISLANAFSSPKAKDPAGNQFVDWVRFMRVVKLGLGEGDDAVDTSFRRSGRNTAQVSTPMTNRGFSSSSPLSSSFLASGGGGGGLGTTEGRPLSGGAVSWGWGGDEKDGEGPEAGGGMDPISSSPSSRLQQPGSSRHGIEEGQGQGGEEDSSQAATNNRGDLYDEFVTAEALEEVARLCTVRRLDIRQAFQDFDHQNRGFVSAGVFDRVLALCGVRPSQPKHMKGLLQKFADATPDSRVDVNYKAFADAVAKVVRGEADPGEVATAAEYRTMTRSKPAGSGNMEEYDNRTKIGPAAPLTVPEGGVEGVLAELCVQLRAKRGRLLDFFKDGDTLGTGELSHFKFRSALGRAGLDVSDDMFKQLQDEFGSGKRRGEMVDWRSFHKALNATKEMMGMYQSMASTSTQQQPATMTNQNNPAFSSSSSLRHVSSSETEELLDAICDLVTRRRILVKPFFQDLDKCNANQVTKAQMGSVLSQNVGISLSDRERDDLFQAFCVRDIKGFPTNRFDYKKFVKRVDAVEIC